MILRGRINPLHRLGLLLWLLLEAQLIGKLRWDIVNHFDLIVLDLDLGDSRGHVLNSGAVHGVPLSLLKE